MNVVKSAEHRFKGLWSLVQSGFLRLVFPRDTPLDGTTVRRILVILPGRIGDMVCALPVVDALRQLCPHATIGIFASSRNEELVTEDPRFQNIFVYRKRLWRDIHETRRARRLQFDCVIDLLWADSITGLYLCRLCAPKATYIGVGKEKYARYYHYAFPRKIKHMVELFSDSLNAFGKTAPDNSLYSPVCVSGKPSMKAEAFCKSITCKSENTRLIGYNLSAGAPTRVWQEEKSYALVKSILTLKPECCVILISMPSERTVTEEIARKLGSRVQLVPECADIREVSAIIARLEILISPDTSLIHIARSFQVPVVGLYPRCHWNLEMWRPYGQSIGTVVAGHEDDIFDIEVDQVLKAFVQVTSAHVPVS